MARGSGKVTQYASRGHANTPIPKREQFLEHDYFYPCQRCGLLWPRRDLAREQVTKLLVCPSDLDIPTVNDAQSRRLGELSFTRFDRLGQNLEELP